MSLSAGTSLVVATAHRAGNHAGKGRPPAGPLDRAILRNSGKKLLGGIESGLVNDSFMGALRIVLGPVSYTHLDVYKRQHLNFSGGKGCIGLFNIAEATLSPKCRLSKGLKGAGARIFSSGIIFPPS